MSDLFYFMEGVLLIQLFSVDYLLYDFCVEVCCSVFDLEILVNIYDFGLIYMIDLNVENDVKVVMILIVSGCLVVGEMSGWV